MEYKNLKRKRKGSRTFLTLNKKTKKYYDNKRGAAPNVPNYESDDTEAIDLAETAELNVTVTTSSQTISSPKKDSFTQTQTPPCAVKCDVSVQCDIDVSQTVTHCVASTQYFPHDFLHGNRLKSALAFQQLVANLHEDDIGLKFVSRLDENEQDVKFLSLVKAISSGRLKCSNICWKAALDMGHLSLCETTSRMVYDREWLEFCQVIYHMFGAGIINTLRGRAHFSYITSEKAKKGIFKPFEGEFNFPVPSITTLKKLDIGYPTQIPVGIIQHSLELAIERAKTGDEFILSFDGKLISPGCKGKDIGDCNMWGREGPPNISKALKILESTLKAADNVSCELRRRGLSSHTNYLEYLL
ncbi:MAG: hypothetical protein MJE68_16785, partial [Proteobacteria bacterium]|nr:hypothetical protein [Pseudomonadota bacterium]